MIFKYIRVIVSLLFFTLFVAIFACPAEITEKLFTAFLPKLQFMPALTSAIHGIGTGIVIVIALSLMTLLLGRIYCSTLCPVGTWQDIVAFITKILTRKKLPLTPYKKERIIIRYGVLTIVAVFFTIGYSLPLGIIEPYAIFGRVGAYAIAPGSIWVQQNILESIPKEIIPKPFIMTAFHYLAYSSALVITLMAFFRNRLFCNTLCPVGTVLGLLSRFSWYKLQLGHGCVSCKRCVNSCKASCIDLDTLSIDYSRCVMCLNCMPSCSLKAIKVKSPNKRRAEKVEVEKSVKENIQPDMSRRSLLIGGGILLASGGIASGQGRAKAGNNKDEEGDRLVSPPGAMSRDHLNNTCTSCQLCISKCPTKVLQPATHQYGMLGFMQPYLNFNVSNCEHKCNICTQVCPTGALKPLTLEEKQHTQIGAATYLRSRCIVIKDRIDCGICADVCPTGAIDLVRHGYMEIPKVNQDLCTGCGACEQACPTKNPQKAILVGANLEHKKI